VCVYASLAGKRGTPADLPAKTNGSVNSERCSTRLLKPVQNAAVLCTSEKENMENFWDAATILNCKQAKKLSG